jgi:thiamine kinase-like enzyme
MPMIAIEEAIARIPRWRAAKVSVAPLGGGITNLNYRVEAEGELFVVTLSSEDSALLGINRRLAHQSAIVAGRAGLGAEVLDFFPDKGILVTRFIVGRRLTAQEMSQPQVLARVLSSMRRCHAGPALPGHFSAFRILDAYRRAAHARGARLPPYAGRLYNRVAAYEAAVTRSEDTRPCHNDLWEFNLLDDGELIRILDWEYAGMGTVYFDLANFAIHSRFTETQDDALLRAYFGSFSRAQHARFKLLKIVAELREAMWAVVAETLEATVASGFDCPGYAATHFERCREALADPRVVAWLRTSASG